MLAPSPDLILLASPLCPMASSIWGKASPAAPLSQLRAPAGTYILKFWHFLQQLAGLHIILHHDQGNDLGAKEVAWGVHAMADPEPSPVPQQSWWGLGAPHSHSSPYKSSCPSPGAVRPHQIQCLSFAIDLCRPLAVKVELSQHSNP